MNYRELVVYALALESASTFDAAIIRPGASSPSAVGNSDGKFLLPETTSAKPMRRKYLNEYDRSVVAIGARALEPSYLSNTTRLQGTYTAAAAKSTVTVTAPFKSGFSKPESVSIPLSNMRRPRYLSQMRPTSPSPNPQNETALPPEDDADILLKLDVNLASIPVLAAPSIGDEDGPSKQRQLSYSVSDVLHELIIPPDDIIPSGEGKTKITVAGTINRIEAELVLPMPSPSAIHSLSEQSGNTEGTSTVTESKHESNIGAPATTKDIPEHGLVYRGPTEQGRESDSHTNASEVSSAQPQDAFVDTNSLNLLLNQVSGLMNEAVQLRAAIPDLSDVQAGKMRAVRLYS